MTLPFFDAAYYLAKNADVAQAGYTTETAHLHYLEHGAAELRQPAAWFDGQAYLNAWPDLATHGVTPATAFLHFVNYGLHEGRAPSTAFDPAKFDAAAYAGANADLLVAFGITDASHPTPAQQSDLWAHYLGYGMREDRPGVAFADAKKDKKDDKKDDKKGHDDKHGGDVVPEQAGEQVNVDGTAKDHIYEGGAGNDTFTAAKDKLNGVTLKGGDGVDLLKATLDGKAVTATLDSIEKLELDVAGKENVLNLAGVGVQSIEVKHDAKAESHFTVEGGAVFGETLRVTLSGGKAGEKSEFKLALSGDQAKQLVVDGSLASGDQTIDITGVNAKANVVLTGGAGKDTLTGTAGIDTMSGGKGNDTFNFSHKTAAIRMDGEKIVAMDSIAGFEKGDTLRYEHTGAGKIADIKLAGVGTITNNVLALNKEFVAEKDLDSIITGIEKAALTDSSTKGFSCIFTFGNDAYFLDAGSTNALNDSALIKLTGVDSSAFNVGVSQGAGFDITLA